MVVDGPDSNVAFDRRVVLCEVNAVSFDLTSRVVVASVSVSGVSLDTRLVPDVPAVVRFVERLGVVVPRLPVIGSLLEILSVTGAGETAVSELKAQISHFIRSRIRISLIRSQDRRNHSKDDKKGGQGGQK